MKVSVALYFLIPFSQLSEAHSAEFYQNLHKNALKYWIRNDVQSLKQLSYFRIQTYETLNRIFQKMVSYYYDTSLHYYLMSDEDKEILNSIIDMLF